MSKRHRQNRDAIHPQELLEALRQGGYQWTGNAPPSPMMQPPMGMQSPMGMQPPMGMQAPMGMQPPNPGQPPMGMQPPMQGQPQNPMAPPMGNNPQNSLSALAGLINGGQSSGTPLPPIQPPQQGGGMPSIPGMMGLPPMNNNNHKASTTKQNSKNEADIAEREELKKLLKEVITLLKGDNEEKKE